MSELYRPGQHAAETPGLVPFAVIANVQAAPDRGEETYQPGSREDFDRLYRNSYPRVFRTLMVILGDPAEAEDCAQDSFVKAFQAWKRWRPEAPAEAWVHRIAVNRAISYRRSSRLRSVGELLRRLGRPTASTDPANVATRPDLLNALRSIPPKLAVAIVLRYYHGYNNREIAAALRVSERTIGNRLREAADRLRPLLEESRASAFSLDASAALSSEQKVSSYADR
ncbi:MAG: RNA polymerase sigma factor [Candidatus Dormibacteraceae bacterium]